MPFNPPIKLKNIQDDTELEYIKTIERTKGEQVKGKPFIKNDLFVYKFTKSDYNKDKEMSMTEVQLKCSLRNFFREIK